MASSILISEVSLTLYSMYPTYFFYLQAITSLQHCSNKCWESDWWNVVSIGKSNGKFQQRMDIGVNKRKSCSFFLYNFSIFLFLFSPHSNPPEPFLSPVSSPQLSISPHYVHYNYSFFFGNHHFRLLLISSVFLCKSGFTTLLFHMYMDKAC